MQKITPFLWFDGQAEEAADFYISIFNDSKILNVSYYGEGGPGPAGSVMIVSFQLEGQTFTALNGGPEFQFTPAISFFVNCATPAELDALWARLAEGGQVLMEPGSYPFAERFGWVADRFGVSWQLILAPGPRKIAPFLMFVGDQCGRAEEAIHLYTSLFDDSRLVELERHPAGGMEIEGTVQRAAFTLHGQNFMAIDSHIDHRFTFNEAISFYVDCKSQQEVDYFWEKLLAGGEESQCGWLKDRFGVSWQIVPADLGKYIGGPDPAGAQRAMQAMLQMKKLDITALQRAYEGK
jgi:predicted 3-demethylubiquinone-9 3-methyltransferase (glyoxalase superfamily)